MEAAKRKKTIVLTEEIIKIGEKYAKQYGLNFSTMVEMVLRGKLEPPLKEERRENIAIFPFPSRKRQF